MIRNVTIVSLSAGTLGENFVRHELLLGKKRLEDLGLTVRFAPHALMGREYVAAHPEKRAEDLLEAFADPDCDLILCAIGGDDTYRLLPYLFENGELAKAASQKPFLGFSDSTVNHFMLNKLGLRSFYGQSFLADYCELGPDMLPYTREYFEKLILNGRIDEIRPSGTWYESRTDFSPAALGTELTAHEDSGFRLLQGPAKFAGRIFGGCLDSIFDMFDGSRYADMPVLCERFGLFPKAEEWRGRILLLETSEEQMTPGKYRKALRFLKEAGVFEAVSGVLVGKPMDRIFEEEYEKLLIEVIDEPTLPIVTNLNVGHAQPRCIVPFGVPCTVDVCEQVIRFDNEAGRRPLIDLHLHLDGAISPESARELAKLQSIEIPEDESELLRMIRVREGCRDLNEFLEKFAFPCSLLKTEIGLRTAVRNLLLEERALGVIYSEIRFAPQLSLGLGLTQEQAVQAAILGIRDSGEHAQLILCAMRGKGNEAENFETVDVARIFLGKGVCAVDLAGAEALFPNRDYEELFAYASDAGVPFTIHAGEADAPESVRMALRFGAKRIGHGVRSTEDPELVKKLAEEGVCLECCPTSNLCTSIYADYAEHPLARLLAAGVRCTVNSDDPAIEGTDIAREYRLMEETFGLSADAFRQLLLNSCDAAFLPEEEKETLRRLVWEGC